MGLWYFLKKWVDVNVHPSKLQVKFADSQAIFQLVYNTISETLWQNKISHQSQHYSFNNSNSKFYYNQNNWVNKQNSTILDQIVSDFWENQQANSPTSEQVKLFDEAIQTRPKKELERVWHTNRFCPLILSCIRPRITLLICRKY